MDIPSGGILGLLRVLFKPIVDFFEMLFFYRAYELSTLHHNHREAFAINPDELTKGIEYKILWKPYHLRKKLITPMIWLRAKNDAHFSKVVITITASNGKINYQDQIVLHDICRTPTQTALPSIPFRNIKIKGNMVYTPYSDIKTSVIELYDESKNQVDLSYPFEKRIRPFDRLEVAMGLEKGDIEKWGEIFNLQFLEMEIRNEQRRLIGSRYGSFYPAYLVRKWLFSFNWLTKIVFWLKNIVFARQLTSSLTKYLEEHEEYKKWEKENEPPENV